MNYDKLGLQYNVNNKNKKNLLQSDQKTKLQDIIKIDINDIDQLVEHSQNDEKELIEMDDITHNQTFVKAGKVGQNVNYSKIQKLFDIPAANLHVKTIKKLNEEDQDLISKLIAKYKDDYKVITSRYM